MNTIIISVLLTSISLAIGRLSGEWDFVTPIIALATIVIGNVVLALIFFVRIQDKSYSTRSAICGLVYYVGLAILIYRCFLR